jgi:hypothetical protein
VWIRSAASVTTTFSTTISGLVVGRHYRVQFRANQRTGAAPSPSISLNGGARVRFTASPAVGGTNPYRTVHAIFVATATTAALEISNSTASASTLLVDHFAISAATPIQVTNANDSGAGSLRAALAAAAGTAPPLGFCPTFAVSFVVQPLMATLDAMLAFAGLVKLFCSKLGFGIAGTPSARAIAANTRINEKMEARPTRDIGR